LPCFDAVYDADQTAYHLLLPDVSDSHYTLEREAPPTQREAEHMIDTLATLHAAWWDKLPPEIEAVDHDFMNEQPFNLAGFFDFMGERLTYERRTRYERLFARLPTLLRERMQGRRLFMMMPMPGISCTRARPLRPHFSSIGSSGAAASGRMMWLI
jgi:hypothetical protein